MTDWEYIELPMCVCDTQTRYYNRAYRPYIKLVIKEYPYFWACNHPNKQKLELAFSSKIQETDNSAIFQVSKETHNEPSLVDTHASGWQALGVVWAVAILC